MWNIFASFTEPFNCNIFITISEVKNNSCYDIKIVHQYNANCKSVDSLLLIFSISLHENVGRVGMDLHLCRMHFPSTSSYFAANDDCFIPVYFCRSWH